LRVTGSLGCAAGASSARLGRFHDRGGGADEEQRHPLEPKPRGRIAEAGRRAAVKPKHTASTALFGDRQAESLDEEFTVTPDPR
jgi:hypothetical protein